MVKYLIHFDLCDDFSLFSGSYELYFIFDDVYILKKDSCPHGAQISVERAKEWEKVDETTSSNLLFLLVSGQNVEGRGEGCSQKPSCIFQSEVSINMVIFTFI